MRNVWMLLFVAVATSFMSEKTFVSARSPPSSADDLYLEDQQSGDFPLDDDDFNSGSGSGDISVDEVVDAVISSRNFAPKEEPTQNTPTKTTPLLPTYPVETLSREEDVKLAVTEVPVDEPEDWISTSTSTSTTFSSSEAPSTISNSREVLDKDSLSKEVHSENLFQRTEVLAAVIAGGVIGFLFAIFLILLLVYRMRKKDEGSYDLGDRKPPPSAYQKAPTKEFYA
ncbi:syndecan-2 [Hypomesus transpacificus]|uniref:syndecan-2 n=1 Tax=Hypomesus transpacificus TaxID=137520 RepID=UPI001F07FCAF|nr:syndecan-2 [Hypomesus transpacificus]